MTNILQSYSSIECPKCGLLRYQLGDHVLVTPALQGVEIAPAGCPFCKTPLKHSMGTQIIKTEHNFVYQRKGA